MTTWHTVRFVDEPEMPHYGGVTHPEWKSRFQAKPIRVRLLDPKVLDYSIAKMRRWGCDCEQFFQVDTNGMPPANHEMSDTYVVCRRMLEMD